MEILVSGVVSRKRETRDITIPVAVLRKREMKWLDMLDDWDKWMTKKPKKVKERCRKGIPSSLRSRAWQILCGAKKHMDKNHLRFKELDEMKGDPKWVEIIVKDLDRQFPYHEMFAEKGGAGQQDLFRVLKAYSLHNPRDGYCQAMAPVASVLLMHMPAEEAFWCFVQICDRYLTGYYSPGLEAVQVDGEVLHSLLKKASPATYKHMVTILGLRCVFASFFMHSISDQDYKAFFASPTIPESCLDKLKASGSVDHKGFFRSPATKKSFLSLQNIDLAARTGMKFASSLLLFAEVLSKSFRQPGTEEVPRKDTGAIVNLLGPISRLAYDQFAKVAVRASMDRRELVLDNIHWPSRDIQRRFMDLPLSGPDLFGGKFDEQLAAEIKRSLLPDHPLTANLSLPASRLAVTSLLPTNNEADPGTNLPSGVFPVLRRLLTLPAVHRGDLAAPVPVAPAVSSPSPRDAHSTDQLPSVGGRLLQFAKQWKFLSPDPRVRSVIHQGYKLEFTSPPPSKGLFRSTLIPKSRDQRLALEKEISDLLRKKAIYVVKDFPTKLHRSSFFLTPKKPDSWRPIINLKPLNKAFLAFRYRNVDFCFRALPFGLSTAPRVFTRVTKVVLAFLRRQGIHVFAYLDDWLLVGRSAQEMSDLTAYTVSLLENLGWIVNVEKSSLIPTQMITYLGAILDFRTGTASPSPQRVLTLSDMASDMLTRSNAPAKTWLRLLGLMASMVDVIPFCRLFMRPIQIHLLEYFSPSRSPLSKRVPVLPSVRDHLLWWTHPHSIASGRPFREVRPKSTITTDAPLSGWGAVWESETLSGLWNSKDSSLHINLLELMAVHLAISKWGPLLKNHEVSVLCDNSTTVSYINRQGGTRSTSLCINTWDLLHLCRHYNILIRASHLAGQENVMADALSRGNLQETEWSLSQVWANHIFQIYDKPMLDLFATPSNAKLPVFCTRFRDWSTEKALDPLDAPVEAIADFFVTLLTRGFPDGSSIGTNTALCHLLKGMFNKRPPRKCLTPSWSINDVLTTLSLPPYEPMHNSTLELLTYKTLFLIAAASARRRSELHALTTKKGFIRFSQSGVFLIPDPSFLTKKETISFTPGEIYLPSISSASSISEDKRVCPVRALKWYLEKTRLIRTSERLFLIPRSPFNPASKDTLSRWLVKLITPHSSPDDPVLAHQLRAHASSKAWFSGVSLDNILRAAAWKTPSTFVACYLSDVISQEGAFTRAVLGVPDHRHPVLPPSSQC
ncbi:TBC1 domain family member 10B [Holothuria leucospilota]|uniref:TBC1 domain family member 10B n=1 Tax=Holothuria leucospilota TaxID=206669 RepID=A0A9Q1CFW1_HOLLE|nr:TBC1 domain family member 10B [Holothuria leucospilota]